MLLAAWFIVPVGVFSTHNSRKQCGVQLYYNSNVPERLDPLEKIKFKDRYSSGVDDKNSHSLKVGSSNLIHNLLFHTLNANLSKVCLSIIPMFGARYTHSLSEC